MSLCVQLAVSNNKIHVVMDVSLLRFSLQVMDFYLNLMTLTSTLFSFLQCPLASSLAVTSAVTFSEITAYPEPPRGVPQPHWKFPYSFFARGEEELDGGLWKRTPKILSFSIQMFMCSPSQTMAVFHICTAQCLVYYSFQRKYCCPQIILWSYCVCMRICKGAWLQFVRKHCT